MAELKLKTQGIRDALASLFEDPTPHEIRLVSSYKYCVNKYNAITGGTKREEALKSALDVSFAKIPGSTLGSLHFGSGYCRLVSPKQFLSDESLQCLLIFMKKMIPAKYHEGVCFVPNVATNKLFEDSNMAANGSGFGGRTRKKHNNDYLSFFANGTKGKELKTITSYRSILFLFNFDNLHFAGAIAHLRDGTSIIYTFDSMDGNQNSSPTHDKMFEMVSAALNHALVYEGKEVRQFVHKQISVPQQTDSCNCGLFQTANGIQLACADNPTAPVVMKALFNQADIVKLREKLPGFLLNKCQLSHTGPKLKEYFESASAQVDQGYEEAEKVAKRWESKLTKDASGNELFDLQHSDDEEEATKPSSKHRTNTTASKQSQLKKQVQEQQSTTKQQLNKPPGTAPASASQKSKHRTNTPASKQSQLKKQEVQEQPSTTKQQSVPSTLRDEPSFKQALLNQNSELAFEAALKSACPMTFDKQQSQQTILKLTQPLQDLLPVLSAVVPTLKEVKKVHKASASEDDIKSFHGDLQYFVNACTVHCYQMLCLHDFAKKIWAKITVEDTNDVFLKDFTKYLVRVVVYGWRANSYLDNARKLVSKDKDLPQFCSDVIFNIDIKRRVVLLYPKLDYNKMRKNPVFTKLSYATNTTLSAIETTLIDDIMRSVEVVTLSRNPDIVLGEYQLSSGERKSAKLNSLHIATSMDAYEKASRPSYPEDKGFFKFRYSHLKKLYDLFTNADLKVPQYLMEQLRDMFNVSLEKCLFIQKRKRIQESSDEESSADESEVVKEKKNESATADCAKSAADKGKKANEVETKNDSSDKNVEKDESPASVGEKEKEANIASPTEEVGDKIDESAIKATKAIGGGEKEDDAATSKQVPKMKEESATKAKTVTFATVEKDTMNKLTIADGSKKKGAKSKKKMARGKAKQKDANTAAAMDEAFDTKHESTKKNAKTVTAATVTLAKPTVAADVTTAAATTCATSNSKKKEVKGTIKQTARLSSSTKRRSTDIRSFVDQNVKYTALESRLSGSRQKRPKMIEDIPYEVRGGGMTVLIGPSSNAVEIDGEGTRPYISKDGPTRWKKDTISIFSHQQRDEAVDVYKCIKDDCDRLQKRVECMAVKRDQQRSIFKNCLVLPAKRFIIDRVDEIEVVDHVESNETDAQLFVRITFPTDEDHDLMKELKSQVDVETYGLIVKTAATKQANDLVFIAFVTSYGSNLVGHQKVVDKLLFHSFILMEKPSTTSEQIMSVPIMWTSEAYSGALLDRLLQIGCLIFWKAPKEHLTIKANVELSSNTIGWKKDLETVACIPARMFEGKPIWTAYNDEKLAGNVAAAAKKMAKKASEMDVASLTHSEVFIPLVVLVHNICENQPMTEVAAELLQYVDIEQTADGEGYTLHCRCCNKGMLSHDTGAHELLQYATRIIIQHYFGDINDIKDVNVLQALGKVKDGELPMFQITSCQPTQDTTTEMRKRYCDAYKSDGACEKKTSDFRYGNVLAFFSVLLQLAEFLGDMSKVADASGDKDILALMEKRPIQVPTESGKAIVPMSQLKPDPSWVDSKSEDKPQAVATLNSGSVEVAGRMVEDGAEVIAFEPTKDQGSPLDMLLFYYARIIISIQPGMTFGELCKSVRGVTLPLALEKYMAKLNFTSVVLVVITDLPKKIDEKQFGSDDKRSVKQRIHHLTANANMNDNLSFFFPSRDFLHLLPKQEVTNLREGKSNQLRISKPLQKALTNSIEASFMFEIKNISLHSKYPNEIYAVTLTSGRKVLVDGNNDDARECILNIQERWLTERLRSLPYVAQGMEVYIGIGKKHAASHSALLQDCTPEVNGANFWIDSRNIGNLCVHGAVANWLYAAGLVQEAIQMKEWATSQHIHSTNEEAMAKVLNYMLTELHIGNFVINFQQEWLSLKETVDVFGLFPAPVILELASASSYQRHAVVVASKRVYDLQDQFPYDFTYSALSKSLNADKNGVTLVSARYFYLRKPKEIFIPGCPAQRLNASPPPHGLIHSFGRIKNNKKIRRRKRKRN